VVNLLHFLLIARGSVVAAKEFRHFRRLRLSSQSAFATGGKAHPPRGNHRGYVVRDAHRTGLDIAKPLGEIVDRVDGWIADVKFSMEFLFAESASGPFWYSPPVRPVSFCDGARSSLP
jgi:hypothetical protein